MLDFIIPTSIYLLGSSLCFIPLFSDELVSFKSSAISRALLSQKGRDLSIASITLAVPICMGILTDVVTSITIRDMSKKIRPHVGRELLSSLERFSMTVAILIVSLPAFLDGNTANFVNIWLCMRRSRLLLVAGAVQVSLCRYDEKFFSAKTSCLSLILMSVGSIIGVCGVNVIRFSTIPAIPAISGALILLGIVVFLRNCWKWLFFVTPKVLKWALLRSTSDPTTGNSIVTECCKHYVFPSILVASSATASIVMVFISSLYPVIKFDSDSVFYDNLGNIFFNVFTMYISDRMMKFEVIEGLYNLIESKKTYVRYISHELRTPLNSACLGLQLVCDELGQSGGIGVSEHRETLLDVQTACRIAVEILNDLLCFDKLESGILELHKHEVPVNSFISDCVNMFGSQAREAGVTIINNSLMKTDPGASNGWLDTDTVLMDKLKMDQVLRNLISNALKFTTRGGCVSVCASFVPDGTSLYLSSMADIVDKPPSVCNILHKLLNGFKIADTSMYDMESAVPNKDKDRKKELNERKNPKSYVTKSNRRGGAVARVSSVFNDASHNINNRTTTDASHLSSKTQSTVSEVTSGRLRIVVTDTGAGISQENLVRLFKEIVQFNPEVLQAGGGSGLGLYITSSIVQMHGGTISAYSAGAGNGSTFTVDIDIQLRRLLSPASPLSRKPCNTELMPVQDDPFPERHIDYPRQGVSEGHEGIVSEGADILLSQSSTLRPRRFSDSNTRQSPPGNTCSPTVATTRQSSLVALGSTMSIGQQVDVTRKQEHSTIPATVPAPPPIRSTTPPRAAAGTHAQAQAVREADAEVENKCESESEVVYDVLVVDDSSLNRKMLCRLLRTAGYICEESNDGQSAVEKVRARIESGAETGGGTGSKGYYDAILMDFVMPIMDGPTATQAIRGFGYSHPIFGVTGNALDSDINYFVKCGANAVLAKPFDFNRFKRLMKDKKQYASV